MVNPYKYKGPLDPVRDELVCIPRQQEVERVVMGIKNGDYWAAIGPRQMGKTTFLRQIEKAFPYAYYIYINFESSESDTGKFYRSIIDEFQKRLPLKNKQDIDKIWGEYGPELTFLNFLETLEPENESKKVVLFFDEIERIAGVSNFLHLWRKVYHERYYKSGLNRYSVVLAGSAGLIPLTKGTNSPFNIAEVCKIGDLPDEMAARLIDEPLKHLNIRIEPAARNEIISRVSGHPQLLQHLCYLLVEKARSNNSVIHITHIEEVVQTLFKENTVLDSLKHHITMNNILEELLRDIQGGARKIFYSNKEFSVAGAGAIVEQGNFCVIRNGVFNSFIEGILSDKKNKALSPTGNLLLKLQERVQTDVSILKEYEEQLVYVNDFFIRQKCEETLERLSQSADHYQKEYKVLQQKSGSSEENLNVNIGNLLQKLLLLINKMCQLLRQKRVLDHYLISDTVPIVADTVKMLGTADLAITENIIVALHSDEIDEVEIHKILSDIHFLLTQMENGTIVCTYHVLQKEIMRLAKALPAINDINLKFMLHLPLIPLILLNNNEFKKESPKPGFDIVVELRELKKKWDQLLETIRQKHFRMRS
ncbi:MAG: AAA family ATPase [bacterium]|nr:AAA family ATPase [bacterium]